MLCDWLQTQLNLNPLDYIGNSFAMNCVRLRNALAEVEVMLEYHRLVTSETRVTEQFREAP